MTLLMLPLGSNRSLFPIQTVAHTEAKYFDIFVIFYLE